MNAAPTPLALIVEDDAMQADIFRRAVENAGFEVEVVGNGLRVLQRLEASPAPSLIVLDLHLPGISGKDILHHIRSAPRLQDMRVILATADPQMASSLDEQSDLVLVKPVSFVQLRDLAARLRAQHEDSQP